MSKNYIKLFCIILLTLPFMACEKDISELENRDSFIGSWEVIETKSNQRNINDAYTVNINRSPIFANEVEMTNFYGMGFGFKVPAVIDGNTITINTFESNDYTFSGEGKLSDNKKEINWTYSIEDPYGDNNTYKSTFTHL